MHYTFRNFGKRYLAICLGVFLTLLFVQPTFAEKNSHKYSSVEEFLGDQKTIRMMMDNGEGFGNQKASVDVIRWLHKRNFSGTIELVYPKAVANKIILLFNLPGSIPKEITQVDGVFIKFIEYNDYVEAYRKKQIQHATLGMTGGVFADTPEKLAKYNNVDVSDFSTMEKNNFSNFLDVKNFVFLFPTPDLGQIPAAIYTENQLPPYFPDIDTTFSLVDSANLTDARNYLEKTSQGKELVAKDPALLPFIGGMVNNNFNVMPTYGWTIGTDDGYFPGNILSVIAGARYAQLAKPELANKPLIIPIFYDFTKKLDLLMQLINKENWGEYELPGADEARSTIKALNIKSVLSIASISDVNTIQKMKSLQPGDILLLSMGPLPNTVFDGLYTYTANNIWPQIREGDNSFNSLIHTGRPHIRCEYEWEIGFDKFIDDPFKSQLENFYQNFCQNLKTWKANPNKYQQLGELIVEANNKESNFSRYFQTLKIEAEKPEHDRTRRALEELIK
jgi:hypothetical protein